MLIRQTLLLLLLLCKLIIMPINDITVTCDRTVLLTFVYARTHNSSYPAMNSLYMLSWEYYAARIIGVSSKTTRVGYVTKSEGHRVIGGCTPTAGYNSSTLCREILYMHKLYSQEEQSKPTSRRKEKLMISALLIVVVFFYKRVHHADSTLGRRIVLNFEHCMKFRILL